MADTGKDIKKAKQLLEAGQVIAIPTETVYGLAGNALDAHAVAEIFRVKNRPSFDPLIVHVPSFHVVDRYTEEVPSAALQLADAFWPGPLTLLLRRKPIIPDLVTAGLPTVGLRCPDHPLTRELLASLDFPLAAPSANPFGYISPTRPEHVAQQLGDKIPYILDGGPCSVGIESTIIGFVNGQATVMRAGGLKIEDIEAVIGRVDVRDVSTSNPQAPGQLQSHYAPRKTLIVGEITRLMKEHASRTIGTLTFSRATDAPIGVVLSPEGNLEEAARNLFAALRTLDSSEAEILLAEFVPDTGLGRAINDRLRRASR